VPEVGTMIKSRQNSNARAHIFVSGRVQGVGFRHSTAELANSLGIAGWARNIESGEVEIVAEGKKKEIEKFVEKIRKGFFAGNVSECRVESETPKGEFSGFEIRC